MESSAQTGISYAATSPEIGDAENRQKAVREHLFGAFDALLDCYDHKSGQFPASVEKNEGRVNHNFRDTAIVLISIERAARVLMGRQGKYSYSHYKTKIYQRCFERIVELRSKPMEMLSMWPGNRGPEALSSALVLEMLALESIPENFEQSFLIAVERVLDALTRSYPPHYAFGGASIDHTEPNAFVTYHALRALNGIVNTLAVSASQHNGLLELTRQIWASKFPGSREATEFQTPRTFKKYVLMKLEQMPQGIGAWHINSELTKALKALEDKDIQDFSQITEAWRLGFLQSAGEAVEWLGRFSKSIRKVLEKTRTDHDPRARKPRLSQVENGKEVRPGLNSMEQVKEYRRLSGESWKTAFFEGMLSVLARVTDEYKEIGKMRGNNATVAGNKRLTEHLENTARIWNETMEWTRDYVGKFSKWATVELHYQLALSTVTHKTNFDPSQIAFLLWIYHFLAPEKNPRLIDKGLEVLFRAQEADGTWPVGAPFWFDRKTQGGIYVASMEIINAVMPLLQERGLENYRDNLDRIFNWVETNRRRVLLPDRGSSLRAIHGWATDKVLERDRLDVWMTALVLRFLNSYAGLLQDFITYKTLEGRYDYDRRPGMAWSKVVEPTLEEGRAKWRFKEKIFNDYIKPFRERGANLKNSMILYGPPGTAKSTLAKAIAHELGWRLVTITPSDFVKDGIEKSESMARTLFQDLRRLRNVVVLFDEIDEMLRSRDDQGGKPEGLAMLRFIVPGMLPKLQDLKQYGQTAGLILIIATNYEERLDPAVKRSGRIDDRFAVLPPDREARRLLLDDFLLKRWYDDDEHRMQMAEHLARHTPGWVFAELKQLVEGLNLKKIAKYRLSTRRHGQGDARIVLDNMVISSRGLNPEKFYYDRGLSARDEALEVFRICSRAPERWKNMTNYVEELLEPQKINEPVSDNVKKA
jgi:adenylate kinase family enzyme